MSDAPSCTSSERGAARSRRAEPRRQPARPRGRPPAGEGPHEAAHRVRGHRRCWSSPSACSGCASSGSRTTGSETLGALQERASAYGKLRSDAACSPAPRGERRRRLLQGLAAARPTRSREVRPSPSTGRSLNAVARIPPSTSPDSLGLRAASARTSSFLAQDPGNSEQLSTVMRGAHRRPQAPGRVTTPIRA